MPHGGWNSVQERRRSFRHACETRKVADLRSEVRGIVYQVVLVASSCSWSRAPTTPSRTWRAPRSRPASASGQPAGFDISQTLIDYTQHGSTYGRAFWVGLLNTLLVAAIGIVFATILGFIIGIARLSKNWLVAQARRRLRRDRSATSRCCCNCCSGTTRVLKALPRSARQLDASPGGIFLNNRGLVPAAADLRQPVLAASLDRARRRRSSPRSSIARWAQRRQMATGQQAAGAVCRARPDRRRCRSIAFWRWPAFPLTFEFPEAGASTSPAACEVLPEFVALLFGLVASIPRPSSPRSCAPASWRCRRARPRPPTRSACARADPAARGHPAGDARDHSAADQPVPQPHQELVAGGGHRLSGSRAGLRRHGAQPDRPGDRGRSPSPWRSISSISLVTSLLMNWYNRRMALVER